MTPEEKLQHIKKLENITYEIAGPIEFKTKTGNMEFVSNSDVTDYITQKQIYEYIDEVYLRYIDYVEKSMSKTIHTKIVNMYNKNKDKPFMKGSRIGPFSYNTARISTNSMSNYNRRFLPRYFSIASSEIFESKLQGIIHKQKIDLVS